MVLTADGTNVELGKPVTGTPQNAADANTVYTLAAGNDGIIDTDVAPINMVHSEWGPAVR